MKKLIAVTASAALTLSAITASAANIKQDKTSLFDSIGCIKEDCDHIGSKKCAALELLEKLFGDKVTLPDGETDGGNFIEELLDKLLSGDKEENAPEQEKPQEKPEENLPENEEPEKPELPEFPEVEIPDTQLPDAEKPEENPEVPDTDNGYESGSEYVNEVLRLVNKYRNQNGLASVSLDKELCAAANVRAKEIKTSFSHTRPNGTSCFTVLSELGISYGGAGENIAYGQSSPEEVMTAWMNSSGHRANILSSSYTKLGVGVYSSGGTIYWAQMFTY